MMRQNFIKLILDVIMIVIFLLVYNISRGAIVFHELVGLGFVFLIATHLLLNAGSVKRMSRNLFDENLPGKTRLNCLINWLLIFSMIGIMVTGILISQVILPHAGENIRLYKGLHSLFSHIGLLLLGIHTYLHWAWVVHSVKRLRSVKPSNLAAGLGAIALALIMMVGSYQVVASQFSAKSEMYGESRLEGGFTKGERKGPLNRHQK